MAIGGINNYNNYGVGTGRIGVNSTKRNNKPAPQEKALNEYKFIDPNDSMVFYIKAMNQAEANRKAREYIWSA